MVWPIWIFNSLLQSLLLVVLLWRRAWRQHPAFLSYIAFNSMKSGAMMWISFHMHQRYFAVNGILGVIGLPVMIAVFVEVFAGAFHPYSSLPKGTLFLLATALGSLVVLTVAAAFLFPGAAPGSFKNTIFVLERSASMIFCGAFAFVALFSSHLGIPWKHRTYGIGAGFMLFLPVYLIAHSLTAMYGFPSARSITWVSMVGYTLALIAWTYYVLPPDAALRSATPDELLRLQKALDYPAEKAESFEKKL